MRQGGRARAGAGRQGGRKAPQSGAGSIQRRKAAQKPSRQSRQQVSDSKALITWIGSPDVGSPAEHQGTTMSLSLHSVSLSACLKQSMKPPVSAAQTVTMLAFMQLICYLKKQTSFILAKFSFGFRFIVSAHFQIIYHLDS